MQYRKLGRTNLDVSVIGLGGEWLNGKSRASVDAIIDTAKLNGINYIDIFMPQASTRDNLGYALAGRRDDFILQGHFCTTIHNGQYERTRHLPTVKQSFDDLLKRLKTDYIDVGMIHYVDTKEDFENVFNGEIIKYVTDCQKQGIIKSIGLSTHNPITALMAIETDLIDVLMFSINPAYDMEDPTHLIDDIMDYKSLENEQWAMDDVRKKLYTSCEALNIGIVAMKPLGAGTLLNPSSSPFGVEMTVAQCCHYALTRPGVKSAFVGCSTSEQVQIAADYTKLKEEDKDFSHILSIGGKIEMTGKCMYCNHCLPCPMGIDVATVTKFLNIAEQQAKVPATIRAHYHTMEVNASACIMCGKCEKSCPFQVKVRENMKQAQELFS